MWKAVGAMIVVVLAALSGPLLSRYFKLDANWVSAIADVVLALTAVVGLISVLLPLRLEKTRRRRQHLGQLIELVFKPISEELDDVYGKVLARKVPLLSVSSGRELVLQINPPTIIDPPKIATANEESKSAYKTYYSHAKKYHYELQIIEYENFKSEYASLANDLLGKARKIDLDLVEKAEPIVTPQWAVIKLLHEELACHIFNTIWMENYTRTLNVARVSGIGFNEDDYELYDVATSFRYANGKQGAMDALNNLVNTLIQTDSHEKYVSQTVKLHGRHKKLRSAVAKIQTEGYLQGDCPALNGDSLL